MRTAYCAAACLMACATTMSYANTEQAIVASSSTLDLRYELTDLDLTDNILPAVQFSDWTVTSSATYSGAASVLEREDSAAFGDIAIERFGGYARSTTTPTGLRARTAFALADPNAHLFMTENKLVMRFTLTPSTQIRLIGATEFLFDPMPERVTSARYAQIIGFIYGPDSFGSGEDWANGEGRRDLSSLLRTGPVGAPGLLTLQTRAQLNVSAVPEPSTAALLLAGVVPVLIRARRREQVRTR